MAAGIEKPESLKNSTLAPQSGERISHNTYRVWLVRICPTAGRTLAEVEVGLIMRKDSDVACKQRREHVGPE